MKQFIEIPQDGESVLINVNHIAAVKSKSFGDEQGCEIFVATPYQREHWTVETGCLIIQVFTLSSSPADRRSSLEVLPSRMNSTQA